jgi:hypothetical protein
VAADRVQARTATRAGASGGARPTCRLTNLQAGTALASRRRLTLRFSQSGKGPTRWFLVDVFPLSKGRFSMGKGNHSQKNDKKNKKPKQEKAKAVVKK